MNNILHIGGNVDIKLYRPSTDEVIYHNVKKNMCGPGAINYFAWRRSDGWPHNAYYKMGLSTDSSAAPTDTELATWQNVTTNFKGSVYANLYIGQNDSNVTSSWTSNHTASPPWIKWSCTFKLPYANSSTCKKIAIYSDSTNGVQIDHFWGIAHIINLAAEEQFTKTSADVLYVNWTIYFNGDRTANEY